MNDKSTLPLYFFLFCQLIEQCYKNHKQNEYLNALKQSGSELGYKIYNLISIRKQIYERPSSIDNLMKNMQTKIFRFLFNYDASQTYLSQLETKGNDNPYKYVHVIQYTYGQNRDNISIYLTWMPDNLWGTAIFFAGIIQAICKSSGLNCQVDSIVTMETGQNPLTQFHVKISEAQFQRWKAINY